MLNAVVEFVSTVAPQLQIDPEINVNGTGTTQQAVDLTTMMTSRQMRCAALAKIRPNQLKLDLISMQSYLRKKFH